MADVKIVPVSKIIEGAITGDLDKVISYANFLADDLEKQGEHRASLIIRKALNPNEKGNICVLDSVE